MKIFITGATGLIGKKLVAQLLKNSHKLTALSRSPERAALTLGASVNIVSDISQYADFDEFDAVINLAGEPIFDHRWTAAQKHRLYHSRIDLTELLSAGINAGKNPPHCFISASAMGFYGDKGRQTVTEQSSQGKGFTARLCADWEKAALKANSRVCLLRTANILSADGGMLKKILPFYRLGLGGKSASGEQFMPWIHIDDMVNIIVYLLQNQSVQGAFNCCAPNTVQNKTFSRMLADALNRPHFLSVPQWALKFILGERVCLLSDSQNAVPEMLNNAGFAFKYRTLESAMAQII